MTAAEGGVVVWLTGLPSSGKSTLARHLAAALRDQGRQVVVLDGDEVRASLVPTPGYDERGRADFYETLARLAALAAGQGLVAIVPATAPRARFRARARELAPRLVEVFVDVPLEECARRDAKGLYARGTADLPGASAPFEPPTHADVVVAGAGPADVSRVLSALAPAP